jgi:spore coat polysaccharide biosynthesis predicted glycosyltransferase SpsG
VKILFRVDFEKKIGFGHISRSLILANFLQKKFKCKIFFFIKNYNNKLFNINNEKFKIYKFYQKNNNQRLDALRTLNIINQEKINCVIVDNYSLKNKWCRIVNKKTKLIVLDDGGEKKYPCFAYINHTINNNNTPNKKIYLGVKYFILNDIFLKLKKYKIKYDFFINLGSGNLKKYILLLINILKKKFGKKIKLIIVSNGLKINNLKLKNIKLINKFQFLGRYIKQSKICIGSGGINNLERVFLNKKNFIFSTSEHQKKLCRFLHKKKKIYYFGDIKKINKIKINKNIIINYLFSNKKIIDQYGSYRISKIIFNKK